MDKVRRRFWAGISSGVDAITAAALYTRFELISSAAKPYVANRLRYSTAGGEPCLRHYSRAATRQYIRPAVER